MSKRTQDRWDRKRAHQIRDASLKNNKRSKRFRKRFSHKKTRSTKRAALHEYKKDKWSDVNGKYEDASFDWTWDWSGPFVFYGHQSSYNPNWWNRGARRMELTTEEIHHLPQWAQHKIQQNIGDSLASDNWRGYSSNRYYTNYTEITQKQFEELIADFIREQGLHAVNNSLISKTTYYYNINSDSSVGECLTKSYPTLKNIDDIPRWLDILFEAREQKRIRFVYKPSYHGLNYYKTHADPNFQPEWLTTIIKLIESFTDKKLKIKNGENKCYFTY